MWDGFVYIEVMREFVVGDEIKRSKWERIKSDELAQWIIKQKESRAFFQTVQSFATMGVRSSAEVSWSNFFMDLDTDQIPERLSEIEKLEICRQDAKKIVDYYNQGFDVIPRIWFTGGRGFHIIVSGSAYGAKPSANLTYIWRHVASEINKKLTLKTLDTAVYSQPRMWRIHNFRHPGSGYYKSELSLAELNLSIEAIVDLASQPRSKEIGGNTEGNRHDEPILAPEFQSASLEYAERTKAFEIEQGKEYTFKEDHPECVKYLLENGLALLGTKNKADMALAGYFKSSGASIKQATDTMLEWAASIPTSLTHVNDPRTGARARQAQTKAVVSAAYSNPKYGFSCGSILTCGMVVDCEKCHVKEIKAIELSLGDRNLPDYVGQKIAVTCDVVGRDNDDLIVPRKVVGSCAFNPSNDKCISCKMMLYFNKLKGKCERTMIFDAANPLTIGLIDIVSSTLASRMGTLFGIGSRCKEFSFKSEWANAIVIYIASTLADFSIEDNVARSRAIYLDSKVKMNASYKMFGYVYAHPKTGKAVFLVDSIEQMQSTLETFSLTTEESNELNIFKPSDGQSSLEKMEEIHSHFTNDFIRIFGREDILMGVDLAYHSIRKIEFQKQIVKGWLDILVIGDTGQGKTETIKRLMEYYGLGVIASGEATSRTGLMYAIQIVQGKDAWIQFGLLCRANGLLVAIDEIHDMNPEDFRALTRVRSEGIVEVTRYVWGKAAAETRLISIANPRRDMNMGSYGFPVMAIPDLPIFKSREDIRRFDFAIGLIAGEIDDKTIHTDVYDLKEIENPYKAELCKNLALWAWTRKPDDLDFSPAVQKYTLAQSIKFCSNFIPEIPLVESADMRLKIARIAVAFAARTYSTPNGKYLIIEKHHIDSAIEFLYRLYGSPSLNYTGYSDEHSKNILSDESMELLVENFNNNHKHNAEQIAEFVLNSNTFMKSVLKTALDLNAKETDMAVSLLISNNFIATGYRNSYKKTPQGTRFLRMIAGGEGFSEQTDWEDEL